MPQFVSFRGERTTQFSLGRSMRSIFMKSGLTVCTIGLLAFHRAPATSPAPPKSEVELLREDVARLQSEIKGLEAILRAKGVLPPPKTENPSAWTGIEIRL